jgi:hypothetical protein
MGNYPNAKTYSDWIYLIYWTGFVNLIQAPLKPLQKGIAIFSDIESEVNDLRVERFKKQQQLSMLSSNSKQKKMPSRRLLNNTGKDADDSWFDISDGLDKLIQPIKEWQIRMQFQMQKLVAEVIEFICPFLRICVYLIFFIQKIWAYILIILGLLLWNGSVPGFENSLYSWVSKFININLYTLLLIPLSILGSNSLLPVIQWK